ncbi:MAG TPA: pyruvate, phosphate dikinase [Rectinema sp.]|jgi:pyruvate,orthophosphate dikinase|nr:pyruvate, phosphate dikinase [Spirochaetaceae bacterium]HNY98153.1 pyruvate, phosphate dikinase [Rectinema sp.]HOE75132.1 pyruvate, phosphate dikinase [Rectinema sp.]HOH04571.1 pyruvate, phosphate dikinase [Rectinema sp.]HOM91658.1 pyruvate, phosphate dikinase [Rectinema sp.]
MPRKKFVYAFGTGLAEGDGTMKELLGGKGAGLHEMTKIGLPVPAGFTITTEVCELYYKNGKKWPEGLEAEIQKHIKNLEKLTKKTLGDPSDPLLVSVRSGAPVSMPGMMETILNLGLTDASVEGLASKTGNRRFALDAYRRFIMMYGSIAMGIDREVFDKAFEEIKETKTRLRLGIPTGQKVSDTDVNEEELSELIKYFKKIYREHIGTDFPQDPWEQLKGAINAVFDSWMAEKAVTYRKVEKLVGIKGTAVNIVQMVFGNKGENSGTGVCFTRDPNTGENIFYGDYLINAQGEDVVAGIRTPIKLAELEKRDPKVYRQLVDIRRKLERHYRDMQDLEFTVEEGKLYMLQCRTGKRSPIAAFRIAVDFVKEKLITKEEAILRIKASDIEGIFYPMIDKSNPAALKKSFLVQGIDAVPGAAVGKVVFNAKVAEEWEEKGEKIILVRKETSPEDVGGMHAAQGILTATGGKTSHAAVVARGWGKCCIVGCEKLEIDYENGQFAVGNTIVKEGDYITLDGNTGNVYLGQLKLVKPEPPKAYTTLMSWVDRTRTLKVRTNADTPYDAKKARELGAEGIGLCRTEHMFFDSEERILAIREMIIADDTESRKKALAKLLPFQTKDFEGIFKAMDGLPVTIRLIDPPLHEFVPHDEEGQRELADAIGVPFEKVVQRVEQLHELNPMLGHRGCRLTITYPEILDMQVTAIITAACNMTKNGIKVLPEIMIPLVMDDKELKILESRAREIAAKIIATSEVPLKYMIGTMIEVPRAALLADRIAKVAEFFSFGTNDLTQMTLGLSRDDAGKFLPDYIDEKKGAIFRADPFQNIDQDGVGMLIRMGIEKGRTSRPRLKVGICGEHGGDPESVKFCHRVGMNYVSSSPFRVPVSRLAAAQAVIEDAQAAHKTARKPGRPAKATSSKAKRPRGRPRGSKNR